MTPTSQVELRLDVARLTVRDLQGWPHPRIQFILPKDLPRVLEAGTL